MCKYMQVHEVAKKIWTVKVGEHEKEKKELDIGGGSWEKAIFWG
jgi:hypothetical protein